MMDARSEAQTEQCVKCGKEADGICENCEAPLCHECDSREWDDVMACADVEGCSARCEALTVTA